MIMKNELMVLTKKYYSELMLPQSQNQLKVISTFDEFQFTNVFLHKLILKYVYIEDASSCRKIAWSNSDNENKKRIHDSDECAICFQPWQGDKVILEECGHCFHAIVSTEGNIVFFFKLFHKYKLIINSPVFFAVYSYMEKTKEHVPFL